MATVTSPPPGVFVPVPTFFKAAASRGPLQAAVDVEAQVSHSVFLAGNGIRGLVLLGSTGEAVHLSRAERSALVAGVRRGLDAAGYPDYPIMAGVLTNGVDETLEWLADYAAAGAQWGLVLTPGYFGPAATTQDNIQEWYTLVADQSPIPILIYNYPGVTNQVVVAPESYSLLAQHPNIVGCKMSHGNVSHHVQVSLDPAIDHAKFRVYSGFGQQLGPIVLFGAAGVIDGMAAFYPRTVVRLMSLIAEHLDAARPIDAAALAEMRRLQYTVSRAEEFVVRFGVVGIKEATHRLTGIGTLDAGGRLPLKGRMTDGEWEKGRAALLADIESVEASLS